MKLIRPEEKYLDSYTEAVREELQNSPDTAHMFNEPSQILQKACDYESGVGLKPGRVRATYLWLVEGERFIAETSVRHELTPELLRYGGHIGYAVRWAERGKGYGTKMLALALDFCRSELGLERVLITCDDDNAASAGVIENNGGVLENKVINELPEGTVLTRRYWIEL